MRAAEFEKEFKPLLECLRNYSEFCQGLVNVPFVAMKIRHKASSLNRDFEKAARDLAQRMDGGFDDEEGQKEEDASNVAEGR